MKRFTAAGCCTLAALMVVMLAHVEAQTGPTFSAGGLEGWTNNLTEFKSYDDWAVYAKMRVGYTVRFVNYYDVNHTVVQVDKESYDSCGSAGKFLETPRLLNGFLNDQKYLLNKTGDLYFICDIPGHCLQGQKMHMQVLEADATSTGTSTPASSSSPGGKSSAPELSRFTWEVVVVVSFSLMAAAATL